ncbi:MAG: bifunctional diaminohydroxyphosphoribosylaminopyrimidine deaminase/5-amino-6-(5-phosphoribosylamino)uracil reductase RibD, partial [Gammaproteobacteria bacterium]|nr:bifunctional diaminohydroxyphosphoribosylaminopyrimidine deaminase/5-amino-6-(5-phosphoribosylamino)uracil reductase RibD [Gammaproteobacteria bacterium]
MNNQSNNHSNQGTENSVWTEFDRQTMALALQLAKKGEFTARPNPMVGCVIVKNGEIIGQGWHQKSGQAHSEVNALDEAGEQAKDATCYVTLEPCAHTGKTAPCAQALIKAGVKQVIAAMEDPFPEVAGKGFEMLRQAGILVKVGLYEEQARALNRGFISRVV